MEWSRGLRQQVVHHWNPWGVVEWTTFPKEGPPQLTTVLRMLVHGDGRVDNVKVDRKSGNAWLDAHAVAAIAAAQPLPPPPPDLLDKAGALQFDLGFRVYRQRFPATAKEDEQHDLFAVIFTAPDDSPTGTLEPSVIRAVIHSHEAKTQACFQRQLEIDPRLNGKMTLRFLILPSGALSLPVVVMSTGLNRALETCLLATVLEWKFPAPKGGRVLVHYPFTFENTSLSGKVAVNEPPAGAGGAAPVDANDPVEVFKGQIVLTNGRLPPSFASPSAFLAALRETKIDEVPLARLPPGKLRGWHIEFVGFFAQPLDDHGVDVTFFEIEDKGNQYVAHDFQYARHGGSRFFSSSIDLLPPGFVAGRRYMMSLASPGGTTLASTTFRLGSGESRKGSAPQGR